LKSTRWIFLYPLLNLYLKLKHFCREQCFFAESLFFCLLNLTCFIAFLIYQFIRNRIIVRFDIASSQP
jgi:hypothetical protein